MCVCVYAHVCVYVCVYARVCVHACVCALVCACMRVCARSCVCVSLSGVRLCDPVLRGVSARVSVGASVCASGSAERRGPAAHHQPQRPGQEEHLRSLTMALLQRLPEVPHLHLQILHLWTTCAAAGEVSDAHH